MNSILQCLSNTAHLRDYCLTNLHRLDLGDNCTTKATLMEGTKLDEKITAANSDPTVQLNGAVLSGFPFSRRMANAKSKFGVKKNQSVLEYSASSDNPVYNV